MTTEDWHHLSLRVDYLHGRTVRRERRRKLLDRTIAWCWAISIPNVAVLAYLDLVRALSEPLRYPPARSAGQGGGRL